MVGQNVGKYRIVDRIGRGGMGTVYRAVDETLHREVAIKVLNAELNDPEVARRFRAEAITVARLSHPGIATIYELFEHEGEWLMVMEFVRGETLESMVARMGPLSAQRAAEFCMQTLAALAHAHSMGVVHRDLKPANIMVTENGSVKVMDFGIARVSGSEHLTNAGFMMGTPAYMAPEQVRGGDIDARADLYAMGVVFYRLSTAKLPFKGDTAFAMVQSQVNDPPTPVAMVREDLPPWVDEVVSRALAKVPEQRFQSAAEFHEALARCLAGLPLSSMYVAGSGDFLMTPPRAMPTGAFATRPMPTPSGPYVMTGSHPTVLSPGTNPSGISASTDPTMLTPAGGRPSTGDTRTHVAVASGAVPAAGTGATAQPAAAAPPTSSGSKTAMLVGAALVVLVAIAGAVMWFKGGTPASPTPETIVSQGTPPAASAAGAGATGGATDTASGVAPVQSGTAVPAASPASGLAAVQTPGTQKPAPPAPSSTEQRTPGGTPSAGTLPSPKPGATTTSGPTGAGARPGTPPASPAAPATPPIGAAARAGSAGGTTAAAADDMLATFPNVRLYVVTDKRAADREVVLNFLNGQVLVMPKSGGEAIVAVPYKRILRATYVRARDPRWDESVPGPPTGLDVGSFMRQTRHWLVIQGADRFAVLRLEDGNFRQILETFERRTGIRIERPKGDQEE